MYRPVTPQIPLQKPGQHYTIPTKAAVLASVDFYVYHKRGYEWFTSATRRMHNDPVEEQTWGHKAIITAEKFLDIECILETEGIEAGSFT